VSAGSPRTLVLVHGGSVTSTAWDPVLPFLRRPVLAVDLPGRRHRPADLGRLRRRDWERSLADDILAARLDDAVLVGHSSAAYVMPGAVGLLPAGTAGHLVLVAATCPREGERPVDALAPKLRSLTLEHQAQLRARARGKTLGGLRPGEPPIDTGLEVVEPEGRMGLEAPEQLFEPVSWRPVSGLPKTYVRGTRDRVIPPDHATTMAANAGVEEIVDLDAEHDVAGSAPTELAAVLDRIAQSSSRPE
jgi:pimeloyl-ACP methyl ester carboxylesterase